MVPPLDSPQPARWSLPLTLGAGLLAVNGLAATASLAAWALGAWAGVTVAVLGAFAGVVAVLSLRPPDLAVVGACVMGAICGTLGAMLGPDLLTAWLGQEFETPVADAPTHYEASFLSLPDAQVFTDLQGEETVRGKQYQQTVWAAPVVGPGWTPTRVVPAWAICRDRDCLRDWSKPFRAGIVLSGRLHEEGMEAVSAAEYGRNLAVDPRAPLLEWAEHPRALLAERSRVVLWLQGAASLGWLAGAALARRRPA